MVKKSPIQWTTKQKQVAELLQQGVRNADVAKQLGIAKSLVTKVSKVLKKGFVPSDDNYGSKNATNQYFVTTVPTLTQTQPQGHQTTPDKGIQHQAPQYSKVGQSPAQEATVLRLAPVTTTCIFTPIMKNARILAAVEWGWKGDMPWEDFFDTIIYLFCRSCGYEIKGYYKVDKDGNPVDKSNQQIKQASSSSLPVENGTGDKEYDEADVKLGVEIAKYLKMMKQKEVQHAS